MRILPKDIRATQGFKNALDHAVWAPVRFILRALLLRSARKVLLTRELELENGVKTRWLKAEIGCFKEELRNVANEIRQIARLSELPSIGNRLMVELTIFTMAAYRTLLRFGISRGDARQVVADIGWDVYAALLSVTSLPFRMIFRDPGARLRNTIRLLLFFPFNAPGAPGYEASVWVEDGDIHTHFTHCPPQSFVRRLVQELGDEGDLQAFFESWCQYDWPGADVIASDGKRGHYLRRQTLSRGDPVCDMCWARRPVTVQCDRNEG